MKYRVINDWAGVCIAETAEKYDAVMLAEANCVMRQKSHTVEDMYGNAIVFVSYVTGQIQPDVRNSHGEKYPTALYRLSC